MKTIRVEIAYARPDVQLIVPLEVSEGSTLETVIRQSGILERFPEVDLQQNKVGVFGKPCKLDHASRAGDRIEIYRPLIADPKEARRIRAANKGET